MCYMKRKVVSFVLLLSLVAGSLSSCFNKGCGEVIDKLSLEITLDETLFKADTLNKEVSEENIAVYTRNYKDSNDNILVTIGGTHTDRAVYRVKYTIDEDKTKFTVLSADLSGDKKANTPIPVNGFTISLPLSKVNGLHIKENQEITVNGFEELAVEYERFDLGTLVPEDKTLARRVSYINPIEGVTEQPCIILISSDYDREVTLPAGAVAINMRLIASDNYRINSIQESGVVPSGSNALIFTGNYNALYAKTFFKEEDKLYISRTDKISRYSDSAAIAIGDKVYKVGDEKTNLEAITENGVYLYNSYFNFSITPARELDFYDVVIVDDMVVYKGEKNKRIVIPSNDGVVASFVGDKNSVAESLSIGDKVFAILIKTKALPDKYLSVGDDIFEIVSQNSARTAENNCVLFTPEYGQTTDTGADGTEIIISGNTIQAVEVSKGNAIIPQDGYVLSVQETNYKNKKATQITAGSSYVLSLVGSSYSMTALKYNDINTVRSTDMLIIYRNKASTETNPYGFEITVNAEGKIICGSNKGNLQIPSGGYVLSGHGEAEKALIDVYIDGADVILDESAKTVTFMKTPMLNVEYALSLYKNAITLFEQAKKDFYDIDYDDVKISLDELGALAEQTTSAIERSEFSKAIDFSLIITKNIEKLRYKMIRSSTVENRAAWYRSNDKSESDVKAVIEKAAALNINAIYLETWYNGMVIGYSDNKLIPHHTIANGDFDALEAFCRIGHEYGIEIHAWVENFFIGTTAAESNPDSLVSKTKGNHLLDSQGNNFNKTMYGDFVFLNPYDKNNRALIYGIYKELITKYDIDGIHLDYIRFPEYNFQKYDYGYNDDIIAGFHKAYNTNVDPKTLKVGTAMHDNWCKFREKIISSWVKEVYNLVMKNKPDLWISCATYPNVDTAPKTLFQNVGNWVQQGWIDEVFSMTYSADNNVVKENAKIYESLITDKAFYSTGLSAFGKTMPIDFASQINIVMDIGADGSSLFSFGSITKDNYWNVIQKGSYVNKAIQTYKLSKTISAGTSDILRKLDKVYGYDGNHKYDSQIIPLINVIKAKADDFNLDNATLKEKITYTESTIKDLANIVMVIKNNTSDSDDQNLKNALVNDFEKLIEYMTQSQNRLKARAK